MNRLEFCPVDAIGQRSTLVALHGAYLRWVSSGIRASLGLSIEELIGMSIPDYVESSVDQICTETPPRGVFYLATTHGELAAMVGLCFLSEGIAEVKRLYVLPDFRGRRFGEVCLRRIMQDARDFGYRQLRLDTAPFMYSARRLYERCGFKPCDPHPLVETPKALHANWVFMACDLEELDRMT